MQTATAQQILDRVAIGISGVCVLHCLITPFLLVAMPVLAFVNDAEGMFHRLLFLLILPTSVVALALGCCRHQDPFVAILGTAGLVQLAVTALWGDALFGETGELILTVFASVMLSAGHLRNHRLCRRRAGHDFECSEHRVTNGA